ncbi:unnamed protein product [Strongylus vulgaris]|uniref:Uncharacterized protein n=1 Tax=Strongylus vulgaris TaxID=40348 RepID=A0A3P7IQY6_STRVU|nr:unnamed protein product [Strongylus vulgaris]
MAIGDARNVIEPLLANYVCTFNSGYFERMKGFYHKNAVMVEKDKSVLWGQKASLLQMTTECGETRMEVSNSKYDGVGDFLNVTTDFASLRR